MTTESERIEITVPSDGSMAGYLARPSGDEALPAVIVFMEIFGINSHIRDVVDRVAAEGYVALAPDYFHRTGPGIELGYDDAGMAEGMGHLGQLKADQMIADANATVAYLESRSDVKGDCIGAMGFCIGGHMTYLAACETGVKAAAAYYGGGIAAPDGPGGAPSTLSRTGNISGRIHCYFGAKDALIPEAQVAAIRSALESAGTDHEIHIYADADHGFHCDQRATYHADSAKDAWQRTFAMFSDVLGS
jgi:carboxymethylenebutenolidase